MASMGARWAFFGGAVVVAAAVVLTVAQVPQPWRGVLVAWLIVGGSAGFLILRLARHRHTYVGVSAPGPTTALARRRRTSEASSSPATGLKIVVSQAASGRRSI